MRKIPSEKDFERAKQRMRAWSKGIDEVQSALRERFRVECPERSAELFVMPSGEQNFTIYIFFKEDQDIPAHQRIVEALKQQAFLEAERYGRGGKHEISIHIEVDSERNVRRKFGNYGNRLR